jgi:putative PIN family toxin of toxin-antitoxin system
VDAVLDTNVIVSALISPRGAPAQIYRAWQAGRFAYVTSPRLLDELARVLTYPRVRKLLAWTDEERGELLEALAYAAKLVIPNIQLDVIAEDPDDNRVLEAAVAAAASHIVTGDSHLLDLGSYEGAEIVTPARFLAHLSMEWA